MINVDTATKNIYKYDGVHKEYYIRIDGDLYDNSRIVDESMELSQSIFDGDNIVFQGCISSKLTFKYLSDPRLRYGRGKSITLSVKAGDTQTILLFTGFIDTCEAVAGESFITVTAYDVLYKFSGNANSNEDSKKYDISDWFNNHSECTINRLLLDLCSKYSITIDSNVPQLVNGNHTTRCGSEVKVSGLSALDLFKDICIINGCFGYITPDGKFSWLYLQTNPYSETGQMYPSNYLLPANSIYPGVDSSQTPGNSDRFVGEYEKFKYKIYNSCNIVKVIVADNEDDKKAGEAGSGTNNTYKVLGNVCVLGQTSDEKQTVAGRLLNAIRDIFYTPYEATNQGLPYVQCGDDLSYYDFKVDKYYRVFVLSRTLKLNQHMVDEYKADGDEYQHTFVVGTGKSVPEEASQEEINLINERIDADEIILGDLSEGLEDLSGDFNDLSTDYDAYKANTNQAISDLQHQGGGAYVANIVSVAELPARPVTNTIYLIRGDVMVV